MKYIISLQSDGMRTYYSKSLSQDIVKYVENAGVTNIFHGKMVIHRLHIKNNTQVKNSWKTKGDWWNWNINGAQKWKPKIQCRQKQPTKQGQF